MTMNNCSIVCFPHFVVKSVNTACFTAQADYDDRKKRGTLGMYEIRPNCNGNGEFVARKCQPGGRYKLVPYPAGFKHN